MLGFFTRCSNTGERIWLVVSVPTGKTGRMTELGPIDDDQWVPEVSFEPARAGRFERERSAAGGFGAVPGVRMRARPVGGALPKLLRLAWGCPY
jgi:hypothetical protein